MNKSTPKRYISTPVKESIPSLDNSASTMTPVNIPRSNISEISTPENGPIGRSPLCKKLDSEDSNMASLTNRQDRVETFNKKSSNENRLSSPHLNTYTAWRNTNLEKNIDSSQFQKVRSGTSSSSQPVSSNSKKDFDINVGGKASSLQRVMSGTSSSDKMLPMGSIKSKFQFQEVRSGSPSSNQPVSTDKAPSLQRVISGTSSSDRMFSSKGSIKTKQKPHGRGIGVDKMLDNVSVGYETSYVMKSRSTSVNNERSEVELHQLSNIERNDGKINLSSAQSSLQTNWPNLNLLSSNSDTFRLDFDQQDQEVIHGDNVINLSFGNKAASSSQCITSEFQNNAGDQFLDRCSSSSDVYSRRFTEEDNVFSGNKIFSISNQSGSVVTQEEISLYDQSRIETLNQSQRLMETDENIYQKPKNILKRKADIEMSNPDNFSSPTTNKTLMDTEIASKLTAFSARLRAIKSPAPISTLNKPRSTGRPDMITPLNNRHQSSTTSTPVTGRSLGVTTPMATIQNMPERGCIVALVEGRGNAKGEVGLAALSISHPVLILCQFSDSPTYPRTLNKLQAINPAEIIIPGLGQEGPSGSKLYDELDLNLPLATIVNVQRKFFSESKGLHAIKSICAPEFSSVELQFHNKFYCLAAASSLLKYLEFSENVIFMPKSLKVEYQVSENSTIIDPETAEHIELINCLVKRKNHLSLFNLMNKCSTAGGTRLLRANLFQPSIDKILITKRLDSIEELINSPALQTTLKSILLRYPDVDQILSLCVLNNKRGTNYSQIDAKMNKVIGLKQILELAPPLQAALESAETPLLKDMAVLLARQLGTCSTLLEMVQLVIQDSVNVKKGSNATKFQRAFAIKQGVNSLLDLGRNKYCDVTQKIVDYSTTLNEEHELPIRLKSNPNRGFYLELPITNKNRFSAEDLPDTFILQQKNKNLITFVTQDLMVMDRLFQKTVEELSRMSDAIIDELLIEIRGSIGFLYSLCEALSNLDLIMSLSEVSSMNDFVKPEFGDNMEIRKGRHPLLEKMPVEVTPNYVMSNFANRLHIITGPNMSGKSTYLRQIVLLQIMAQVGCYVPAEFACFRIADRIFSRVSNRDSIEANASTFMLEMKETAYILANVSPSSLIIIDELGRGTAVDEGSAICWAICEKLLETTCFTFLATHFPLLAKLEELYPWVSNHHFLTKSMEVNEGEQEKREHTHQLVKGTAPKLAYRYGIQLASISPLPKEVINNSRLMAEKLVENDTPVQQMDPVDRGVVDLVIQLRQLSMSGLKGDELKEQLKVLQAQYLEKLDLLICGEEEVPEDVVLQEEVPDQI